jgi:hypothetical protein
MQGAVSGAPDSRLSGYQGALDSRLSGYQGALSCQGVRQVSGAHRDHPVVEQRTTSKTQYTSSEIRKSEILSEAPGTVSKGSMISRDSRPLSIGNMGNVGESGDHRNRRMADTLSSSDDDWKTEHQDKELKGQHLQASRKDQREKRSPIKSLRNDFPLHQTLMCEQSGTKQKKD